MPCAACPRRVPRLPRAADSTLAHASVQESFNAGTYTQEGLDHIQSTTFKSLLLRHYPELEASIGNPLGGNAFYAWTGTPVYGAADVTDAELGPPQACPVAGKGSCAPAGADEL